MKLDSLSKTAYSPYIMAVDRAIRNAVTTTFKRYRATANKERGDLDRAIRELVMLVTQEIEESAK